MAGITPSKVAQIAALTAIFVILDATGWVDVDCWVIDLRSCVKSSDFGWGCDGMRAGM